MVDKFAEIDGQFRNLGFVLLAASIIVTVVGFLMGGAKTVKKNTEPFDGRRFIIAYAKYGRDAIT